MRVEIVLLLVTGFLIYNTYHDGKYTKMFMAGKKYYQMAFYGVLGIGVYLLLKRNPAQCKTMLLHANNMVKYMPIDKSSMNMINPILDFTAGEQSGGGGGDGNGRENNNRTGAFMSSFMESNNLNEQRILQSGKKATKRSVSETKKKFVASQQSWKCGDCQNQLTAWFEVDHVKRLEYGGGNEVGNLVALCRECHGKKTAMENM
jgi:hypothetical protein